MKYKIGDEVDLKKYGKVIIKGPHTKLPGYVGDPNVQAYEVVDSWDHDKDNPDNWWPISETTLDDCKQ